MTAALILVEKFFGRRYIDTKGKALVETDGRTVWVNDDTGCCIGRLSMRGVDIHHRGPSQVATGRQCLDCAHDLTPPEAWAYFVAGMEKHHGVLVLPEFQPKWSQDPQYQPWARKPRRPPGSPNPGPKRSPEAA